MNYENKGLIQVLIYSDSTALPRGLLVGVKSIWPEILLAQLKSEFPRYEFILINRSQGGIKVDQILELIQRDYPYFYTDKDMNKNLKTVIILSIGIVDGSPQPITYKLKFISKIPYLGIPAWSAIKKLLIKSRPSIQRIWNYTPTKLNKFRNKLKVIKGIFESYQGIIIVVDTPEPHPALRTRSPGIHESIRQFNSAKQSIFENQDNFTIVNIKEFNEESYISAQDGHHYSIKGHKTMANMIFKKIKIAVVELDCE